MPTDCITDNTTAQNGTPDSTYSGSETTYIGEPSPDYTYHSDGASVASFSETLTEKYNILIRFTGMTNIPAGATVSSATLYIRTGGGFGSIDAYVYECLRAWTQSAATWNDYNSTSSPQGAWATSGGVGSGDLTTPEDGTATINGGSTWYSLDVTTATQAIIDGTNNGYIITGSYVKSPTPTNFWQVHRENASDGSRPELFITYTTGSSGAIQPALVDQRYRRLKSGILVR